MRSAPQKQPMPKIAVSTPSGNGPLSGVPSTAWRAGTGISASRPGSAEAASTTLAGLRVKSTFCSLEQYPQATQQVGKAGVLDSVLQAHTGLFEHAPRRAVARRGEPHDFSDVQLAGVLDRHRRH